MNTKITLLSTTAICAYIGTMTRINASKNSYKTNMLLKLYLGTKMNFREWLRNASYKENKINKDLFLCCQDIHFSQNDLFFQSKISDEHRLVIPMNKFYHFKLNLHSSVRRCNWCLINVSCFALWQNVRIVSLYRDELSHLARKNIFLRMRSCY